MCLHACLCLVWSCLDTNTPIFANYPPTYGTIMGTILRVYTHVNHKLVSPCYYHATMLLSRDYQANIMLPSYYYDADTLLLACFYIASILLLYC